MQIQLKVPHAAQRQVMDGAKRFNVVACGRRWGKTDMGVEHLAIPALLRGVPVGWFAPTYKLLDEAWTAVLDALKPILSVLSINKNDRQIRMGGGGVIDFWTLASSTSDASYAGRGRKYALAIIDEAAHAKHLKEDWTKAIRPTLADLQGDAWFFSTPRGREFFFSLYSRESATWASFCMPTASNPFIAASEIEDARMSLPADAFAQEYLAEFLANASNPFGLDYIRACIGPVSDGTIAVWGIDLAKSHDWTVAVGLDAEGSLVRIERWQGDWLATQDRLVDLIGSTAAFVDSTGVGDPICEVLELRCPLVSRYQFTSRSKQQLMDGLAVAIQRREVRYPEGVLSDELETFEYQYRGGHVYYSAPSGLHDDCVCAMALALACLRNAAAYAAHLSVVTMDSGGSDDEDDDDGW